MGAQSGEAEAGLLCAALRAGRAAPAAGSPHTPKPPVVLLRNFELSQSSVDFLQYLRVEMARSKKFFILGHEDRQ